MQLSKLILFTLCLIWSVSNSFGQDFFVLEWGEDIPVATSDFDDNRPKIALNEAGEPVVIWGKSAGQIYTSVGTEEGFTTPVQLNPEGTTTYNADWTGPEIAAANGEMYAVFQMEPQTTMGVHIVRSTDGGFTWSDTVRVDQLDYDVEQARYPNVAINGSGQPLVGFMKFEGNWIEPHYVVATSADFGVSFSTDVNASNALVPGEACDCCMGEMVSSPTRDVMLYRNNDNNIREMYAVSSADGGQTFDQSWAIDQTETYSNTCFSSGPDGFVAGDKLYAAFRGHVDSGIRAHYSVSDVEDGVLETHEMVDNNVAQNIKQTAVRISGNADVRAVVWEEYVSLDHDIIVALEWGEGFLWRDTVNTNLPGQQNNPDIIFDGSAFHIVYTDKDLDQVMYRKGVLATGVNVVNTEMDNSELQWTGQELFWDGSGNWNVQVFDLAGKLIHEQTTTSQRADLSILASGIYSVQVWNASGKRMSLKINK